MNRVFVIYILLVLLSCKNQRGADLNIVFDRIDNIIVGSEVKMNGYIIGEVLSMKLLDKGVLVSIHFREKVRIPKGSNFSITSPLIGNSILSIHPSSASGYLTRTDTVTGYYKEEKVLDRFMSDSVNKKNVEEGLNKIREGLEKLLESKKASSTEK